MTLTKRRKRTRISALISVTTTFCFSTSAHVLWDGRASREENITAKIRAKRLRGKRHGRELSPAGDPCCSNDLATCLHDDDWCSLSKENCDACPETFWAPVLTDCKGRYHECQYHEECCGTLVCAYHAENLLGSCNLAKSSDEQVDGVVVPRVQDCTVDDECLDGLKCMLKEWGRYQCGFPEDAFRSPDEVSCKARSSKCATDSECCEGMSCLPNETLNESKCEPSLLTTSGSVRPTTPTTSEPTAEATVGPLPPGPFITASKNSERVTLPSPPLPIVDTGKDCPHLLPGLTDWNDTWSGDVLLPSNKIIIIRKSLTQTLGLVTIPKDSSLIIGENRDGISLDVGGIDVRGKLIAGSETCRIKTPIIITLHGLRPASAATNVPVATFKGIVVTGELQLHGKRYYRTWTRLAKTVAPGNATIVLQDKVNWEPGQEIVLVTSAVKDSREWHQNEVRKVLSVSRRPAEGVGAAVQLDTGVTHKHVAIQGYQSEVGLLSRMITIRGSEVDSEPIDADELNCRGQNNFGNDARPCGNKELTGFGGHIMLRLGSLGQVEGVELHRMGQTNVVGRYPIHFHLLGNCSKCYFRDSSVHRSFFRCVGLQDTQQMHITENVAYDVVGHCYYFGDGVEEQNTLSFNLGAFVHMIGPGPPTGGGSEMQAYYEGPQLAQPADVAASAFFITNVRNRIIGNAASGGFVGFSFPSLPGPIGPSRGKRNMRPSSALTLAITGNSAHSTGWWQPNDSGAMYFGGSLYYEENKLTYIPGRSSDLSTHGRNTCKENVCETKKDCSAPCDNESKARLPVKNSKVFLVPSIGIVSWSGRLEILGYETHDVGLPVMVFENRFWVDNMLAVCRSGEEWVMPTGASAAHVQGDGFRWYDTNQHNIISNSIFRNCGLRSEDFTQYDTSPLRGCDSLNREHGCSVESSVFTFVTHSDELRPGIIQATKNVTLQNCGRRYRRVDFSSNKTPEASGLQHLLDADSRITEANVPSVISSGGEGAGMWCDVDDEVVHDKQGPMAIWKIKNDRGIGRFSMKFDGGQCANEEGKPCDPVGYIKHLGSRYSADTGLPISAAHSHVVGPVGGFGWFMEVFKGAPKRVVFELIEVDARTPLLLSIAYPLGTTFTITANAASCDESKYICRETFTKVDSRREVRISKGNVYHFNPYDGLLTVRIIRSPKSFLGYKETGFLLPDFDTAGLTGVENALSRFERSGVLLGTAEFGPFLQIDAHCGSNDGFYCSGQRESVDIRVCDPGYEQTAYDTCCDKSECYTAADGGGKTKRDKMRERERERDREIKRERERQRKRERDRKHENSG